MNSIYFLPFTTLAVLSAILKWSKVISCRQLGHQNILRVAQWKIPHEGVFIHVHFPRWLLVFTIITIAHERNPDLPSGIYDIVVAFECVLKRITLACTLDALIQKIAFAFTKMSPFVQIIHIS